MALETDFEITLSNRPGAAAEVGEALGAAGINIEGACAHGRGGEGVIHVLIEGDPAPAREALAARGLKVAAERHVVVVSCADTPGELGRILRRIAVADVNLVALYLTTNGRIVIAAEEPEHITGILT
jgi:hypothetical protein